MTRSLTVAAAQMGPIQRAHTRAEVVERLLGHLRGAAAQGADLVVFPELTLTTFFPRWYFEDTGELDTFYEREMPGPETKPLFDEAARLGVAFALGFAELTPDGHRYNTMLLVGPDGSEIGRYRKIHLPGHAEHEPWREFQHLEKRYFESPDEGFGTWRAFGGVVGMAICNDRRWSETWRLLGLGGAELVLVGYNTPVHNPPAPDHDEHSDFHNHLVMQAGAYQNGLWVVGVAKAGDEEGVPMIGGSCVIAPSGRVVAEATTTDDELVVAEIDLDACVSYKTTTFDFELHRRIEKYGPICTQRGAVAPE